MEVIFFYCSVNASLRHQILTNFIQLTFHKVTHTRVALNLYFRETLLDIYVDCLIAIDWMFLLIFFLLKLRIGGNCIEETQDKLRRNMNMTHTVFVFRRNVNTVKRWWRWCRLLLKWLTLQTLTWIRARFLT